ncbi:MAG: hypothetical protein V4459_11665 [Pseudomonadota bacterium]
MKLSAATLITDAWRAWRADWNVLTAVAGVFVLLPTLAAAMLIPDLPDASELTSADPANPAFIALQAAMQNWIVNYALWQLGAIVVALFGQFALVAIYLTPNRASVGQGLRAALRLFLRFMLASMIWTLPIGLLALVFIRVPFLLTPVLALVLARTLLVAPAIVAARPIGAVAAVGRSFALTRGNTMMLASVVLTVVVGQLLIAIPLGALDHWMSVNAPNPIARAVVDVAIAAAQALAAIAMALLQVSAWRRLSSS